jgi:membrane-associated phospholipid phosphatase
MTTTMIANCDDRGRSGITARKNASPRRRGWIGVVVFLCSVLPVGLVRAQQVLPAGRPAEAALASTTGQRGERQEKAAPGQTAGQAAATVPAERQVSERQLPANFLHDQKDLWLFPLQLARGHHWLPTVAVVGVTAGLLTADAHDAPYFRRTTSFGRFNRVFAGNIANAEIVAAPASFYLVGLLDKDPYARKTGLLAGEALADVTVLSVVMKGVTRRLRPENIPPNGNFSDTFFQAQHSPLSSSFPSGHTISAFAVATVIARRYGKHRWVPWVAYGVAGAIGFSRISLQAHFPSDVFMGAALGYVIGRFDVLRQP